MRDKISIPRVNLLHPAIRIETAQLIDKAEAGFPENMAIRIVQGLRTIEQQNELFAQGRTKPGLVVTKAKGGSSFHNYGLAIDFAILHDKDGNGTYEDLSWDINYDFDKDGLKDWQEVVAIFLHAGWSWGGNWHSLRDNPHLEKTFGYGWRDLFAKYNAKDFVPGTEYVNI